MNELSSQYDVDTVNAVEANMARRRTAFLSKYQNQITGGVPTDRNTFYPAVPPVPAVPCCPSVPGQWWG